MSLQSTLFVLLVYVAVEVSGWRMPSAVRRVRPFPRPLAAMPSVRTSSTAVVLQCDSLSKAYTEISQFSDASLSLVAGQCVALIGPNGTGKSTLLKCLAGVEHADSGSIKRASDYKMVYVAQQADVPADRFGYDLLYQDIPTMGDSTDHSKDLKALVDYYDLQNPLLSSAPAASRSEAISSAYFLSNAFELNTQAMEIMSMLHLTEHHLFQPIKLLSGGEQKKLSLAAAFLRQPDVLLLDEPTNHIDTASLHSLAAYLNAKALTTLLITHDRYFLNLVCNSIVNLEHGKLVAYQGNYDDYVEQKAASLRQQQHEADMLAHKISKEAEWMAKQPQARQAKSKSRQDAFYELKEQQDNQDRATSAIILNSNKHSRLGDQVITATDLSFVINDRMLFEGFNYNFRKGDRIGIVGPNGVGKSTLMKLLSQQLTPTTGTVDIGETVRIGYYSQTGLATTPKQEEMSIFDYIVSAVKVVSADGSAVFGDSDIRKWLTNLQFPVHKWSNRLFQLSGGERRRLQLLHLIVSQPNVMMLDEPTNDLDLQAITALEDYLANVFPGVVMLVSHDVQFVNRLANHLFIMPTAPKTTIGDYWESYDSYLQQMHAKATELKAAQAVSEISAAKKKTGRLDYNERKELGKLQKEISKLSMSELTGAMTRDLAVKQRRVAELVAKESG